jgi:hypothetical protein
MAAAKTTPKSKASVIKPPQKTVFDKNLKCSFCEKPAENSRRLIALPPPSKICICDECVEVCIKILLEENPLYFVSRISDIFDEHLGRNKSKVKTKGEKTMNTKKTTKTAKVKPQPKAQTRAKQKGKQRPKSK